MTSTFDFDPDGVKMNHYAKCLDQMSFRPHVIVRTLAIHHLWH